MNLSGGVLDFLMAFLAGFLSFLSPCILPLVPGYISWVSGFSLDNLVQEKKGPVVIRQVVVRSALFVLGFSLIFILLGAAASAAGIFLLNHRGWLNKLAGIVIILFGLHLTGILPIKLLYREKRFAGMESSASALGAVLLGAAFAFGWTPCIGPVLAGILGLAATQESVGRGMVLLSFYSAGLGIPFVLSALALNQFMGFLRRYKRYIRWGEVLAGVLLILVGILIFTNRLTFLLRFTPDFLFRFVL